MTSKASSRVRASNMELLRIVSMLLVVLVHVDGASLGLPFINGNLSDLASRGRIYFDYRCELFHAYFRLFWNKTEMEGDCLLPFPVCILFCIDSVVCATSFG